MVEIIEATKKYIMLITGKTVNTQEEIIEAAKELSGEDDFDIDNFFSNTVSTFLRGFSLTNDDYASAAEVLGCDENMIKAFTLVESAGNGFMQNGYPKILFERHKFYKYVAANIGQSEADALKNEHPDICNTEPGGYTRNKEFDRYKKALGIHAKEAMLSTSYGLFQIMGFNYARCGYETLDAFVNKMEEGASYQLHAVCQFIKSDKTLHEAVVNKDWVTIAKLYNGPKYNLAKPSYDVRLENAYKSF